jgi:hypothetical protein
MSDEAERELFREMARGRQEREKREKREALSADRRREEAAQRYESMLGRIQSRAERMVAKADRSTGRPAGNVRSMMKAFTRPGIRNARAYHDPRSLPSPPRPLSADGGQTFHFSITALSKTDPQITAAITGTKRKGTAASHAQYIEREGAAEEVEREADAMEREIGRGRKEAEKEQAYIERQGAPEGLILGSEIASFGNIADTYEKRLEFWKKLEKLERNPGKHTVTIDRSTDPDFWERVLSYSRDGNVIPDCIARCSENRAAAKEKVDDREMLDLIGFMRLMGIDDRLDLQDPERPVRVSPARGGRVQTRIIAELPHEMTPRQRLDTAKEYCRQFDELSLPYWAVIHAPNHHNDQRNFHIHIALSERPAKRMNHPDTNEEVWDFEVVHKVKLYNHVVREQRPFIQNRNRDVHHRDWATTQRFVWCRTLNQNLERAKIAKKYDPRSYKAMGIVKPASTRLSTGAFVRERKGEVTKVGLEYARAQWDALAVTASSVHAKMADVIQDRLRSSRDLERYLGIVGSDEDIRRGSIHLRKVREMLHRVEETDANRVADRYAALRLLSRIKLIPPTKRNAEERAIYAVAKEVNEEDVPRQADEIGALNRAIAVEALQLRSITLKARKTFIVRTFQKSVEAFVQIQRQSEGAAMPPEAPQQAAVRVQAAPGANIPPPGDRSPWQRNGRPWEKPEALIRNEQLRAQQGLPQLDAKAGVRTRSPKVVLPVVRVVHPDELERPTTNELVAPSAAAPAGPAVAPAVAVAEPAKPAGGEKTLALSASSAGMTSTPAQANRDVADASKPSSPQNANTNVVIAPPVVPRKRQVNEATGGRVPELSVAAPPAEEKVSTAPRAPSAPPIADTTGDADARATDRRAQSDAAKRKKRRKPTEEELAAAQAEVEERSRRAADIRRRILLSHQRGNGR